MATQKYSKNQLKFIRACKKAGLTVYYDYSGRGMLIGDKCPAVDVNSLSNFPGNPNKFKIDSMGLGYVVYAPY